jgi:hypothetical protein
MTGGLDAKRLRKQWQEIAEVQERHPEIRILRSQEVDILADGSLDLEDEMLEELDLVVVSVHSRFDLPVAEQTKRVLAAIQHPQVDILAHPTGRLINKRPPFELALDEVLHCAKENNVIVELNAHPERLDLKDTHLMLARELGLKVAISTDSHRVSSPKSKYAGGHSLWRHLSVNDCHHTLLPVSDVALAVWYRSCCLIGTARAYGRAGAGDDPSIDTLVPLLSRVGSWRAGDLRGEKASPIVRRRRSAAAGRQKLW